MVGPSFSLLVCALTIGFQWWHHAHYEHTYNETTMVGSTPSFACTSKMALWQAGFFCVHSGLQHYHTPNPFRLSLHS